MKTTTSGMSFHVDSLLRDSKVITENKMYDAIIEASKRLFTGNVTVDTKKNRIVIVDKITIELCYSWNEPKVYINSFISSGMTPEEYYKLSKQQPTVRFFSLQTVLEYLYIKQSENEFIKQNEG